MKIYNIKNGIKIANENESVEVTIQNEKWITVHPNGEDEKGRHLLLEDGETPKDAMKRQWGVDVDKKTNDNQKEDKKEQEKNKELKDYIISTKDGGMMAATKRTVVYKNGDKSAVVEEGDDYFRAHFFVGDKSKEIKYYQTKGGFEKSLREHLEGKETPFEKTNLEEKKNAYEEVLKRYNENESKKWKSDGDDYYKYAIEAEKAKKELTKARKEYAESIMANFEKVEDNTYEEKLAERKERYEARAEKLQKESEESYEKSRKLAEVIPFGQPIIVGHYSERSDRNLRDKIHKTLGKSVELSRKADYYAEKAESVGTSGISSDDANAIAKLAEKYKSGVDSAEKRRIIDRVIEIHKRKLSASVETEQKKDYSDLGFELEKNTSINRLQLKFSGIPSGDVRAKLKSFGFRWSPKESAWQRQLTGNAEYSFKRLVEELRKENG